MDGARLNVSQELLAALCREFGVRRLSLFGSVLRPDFGPESDIDVLVEFQPETRATLFTMARLEQRLEDLAGRRVDLRTPAELSATFRDEVIRTARVLHAA